MTEQEQAYHSALSQCAELLDNMKDGDPLTMTPVFLAAKLMQMKSAGAAREGGNTSDKGSQASSVLTDERILRIAEETAINYVTDERRPDSATIIEFARAIEAEVLAQAGVRAEPVGWATFGTKDGKQKLDQACLASNPDYIAEHKQWIWQPVYLAAPTIPAQVPAAEVRAQALEEAAKLCDEMEQHYSDYKDTALLNGEVDLSNAASGEPRACRFLAERIRNLAQSSTADFDYSDGGCPGYCTEGGNTSALGEGADRG